MSEGRGIRSTVSFSTGIDCPVANLSDKLDTHIRSVRTSIPPADGTPAVLEFALPSDLAETDGIDPVFTVGSVSICRLSHEGNTDCPCTVLGGHETPIARFTAEDGRLTLVFHTRDFDELQTVVRDLNSRFQSTDIRKLIRSPPRGQSHEYSLVDTGRLTNRQLEMLEVAFARGYFERPRRANATEIADDFGIDPSTFREHINLGLTKLLDDVLVAERPST